RPGPVLAGTARADETGVEVVTGVEPELELELLLQPAAASPVVASRAAATAAKPILLSLRTVAPPEVDLSAWSVEIPRDSRGRAGVRPPPHQASVRRGRQSLHGPLRGIEKPG